MVNDHDRDIDRCDTRKDIYRQAINTFGQRAQIVVAIEELSELQKELCKLLRGFAPMNAIDEEMADVQIMMGQLALIFGNDAPVDAWMDRKIERLKERIEEAGGCDRECEEGAPAAPGRAADL